MTEAVTNYRLSKFSIFLELSGRRLNNYHRMGYALHFYLWLLQEGEAQERSVPNNPEWAAWDHPYLLLVGMTRADYADEVGISQRTVSRYLSALETSGGVVVIEGRDGTCPLLLVVKVPGYDERVG